MVEEAWTLLWLCCCLPIVPLTLLFRLFIFSFFLKITKQISLVLLNYNWHITFCKYKAYNVCIWYTYILQNYYIVELVNTAIVSHNSVSSVQSPSSAQLFVTPWTAAYQASPSITNSWSLLKLVSTESVMPSNHLILCCPLLLLPLIFPSIRVFSNESTLHIRWPKYRSFSFSISPSNEYSGLISCRIDWFDNLAVQGTLKSLLQHSSQKASILRLSAFFIVQLSIHTWLLDKP